MMEKIKIMIVEDMQLVAEDIAAKLEKHNMEVTGTYDTGEAALESLEVNMPDLILMDVQLAGAMDGISSAKLVTDKYPIPVIYLSDFVDDKTVQRAAKTLPANYLSKPFNESDLIRAITIAFTNATESGKYNAGTFKDHIFIKQGSGYMKLAYDDIFYLAADGAYCTIFTADEKYMQTISMNHVLEQLQHKGFIRVHRSYAVNMKKVTEIDGNVVTVGKHKVQMSKNMREALVGKVNILK